MMKKAMVEHKAIYVDLIWTCPYCGMKNEIKNFYVNPYRALAENLPDECCMACNEFAELTSYIDRDEE